MEIDEIPFEQHLFHTPSRCLNTEMDLEEPIVANIVINGQTILYTVQSTHWEPTALKGLIMEKFGIETENMWESFSITDIEIRASGSSIVIDELIDFIGKQIKSSGELKRLKLQICPNAKLTLLTAHVFDVLAEKCNNLDRFELLGAERLSQEQPRRVLLDFVSYVMDICDKEKNFLQDFRFVNMTRNEEEALAFFEFLGDTECITQLQKLALTGMSKVFVEGSPQLELGLDLIARQKVLKCLYLDSTDLSSEVLTQVLDRLMSGSACATLRELGLCNATKIDRQSGKRVIDLVNRALSLRFVDIRRTGSHEPQSFKLRIIHEESTGVQTQVELIETIDTTTNAPEQEATAGPW